MGCGMYLFLMTWGMGIFCTIGGFIVQPRSQAPAFFAIGIGCLIAAAIWTYAMVNKPKREAEAARQKKLSEQREQERRQKHLAQSPGLQKYHEMDVKDAADYQEGIAAMRQLGIIMQQSVYQEKEKDWAVLGGIADGIAGPAAGIVTAANAMQDNVRIRAENAARREWGAQQAMFYNDLASQAAAKSPVALSMNELEKRYTAVMSWSPVTLFELLTFTNVAANRDLQTGAVNVTAKWEQKDKSLCIDGAIRAKLYTEDKHCAGCAYLVFPKQGSSSFAGELSGVCAEPKPSATYSVVLEPADLWELAGKKNRANEGDGLSVEEHRNIVNRLEGKYALEL